MNSNIQLKQKIYDNAIMGLLNKRTDNLAEDYFKMIVEEQKKYNYKKQDVLPLNKNDFPFEIPSNWIWQKIGNLEEINLGFTYKPEYSDDGVIFLSVKDISSGTINFNNVQHVSKEVYNNAAYGCKPKKGDILFGRIGTIGVPYILDIDDEICIFVSLGFFRDYTELINKKYICYWMNSTLFKNQVRENVKGAAQINLNTNWLKEFYIPLPPKEEQDKIVEKVESLFELLETKEKNDKEKEKLKSLLKDKILDSAIKDNFEINLRNDKQYPFNIPNSWTWKSLNDISEKIVDGDHNPPKGENDFTDYFMLSAINICDNGLSETSNIRYLSKENFELSAKRTNVEKGDILLSIVGTIGKCFIYNSESNITFQRSVSVIKPSKIIYNKYLLYCLKTPFIQKYMNDNSAGAVQRGFYLKQLKELLIPVPPIEEQHRIVNKVEQCLELIEQL